MVSISCECGATMAGHDSAYVDRAAMIDAYDYGRSRFQRGCSDDFNTLPRRVTEALEAIPGFKNNSALIDRMTRAMSMYDQGNYREVYTHLTASVERLPAFKQSVYYYIRVCHRVLAVPLTSEEKQYEAQVSGTTLVLYGCAR